MWRTALPIILLAISNQALADINRDDAATLALKLVSGRVLAVDKVEHQGKTVWRVKVLTSGGVVRVIMLDAATGRPV